MPYRKFELKVQGIPDRAEAAGFTAEKSVFAKENDLGLKWMRVEKERIVFENARGEINLLFQRGETICTSFPGWPDVPATISAGWVQDYLLRIRCFAIGNAPCGFDMMICMKNGQLTVQSRCSGDPVTVGYDGAASSV